MAKKPDIWMPWYIGDYMADTAHLSNAEHGSYMLMLAHAWMNNGILPLDDSRLCRLARMAPEEWEYSRETIMEFWTANERGYVQNRLSKELAKAKTQQEHSSKAGKKAADARWHSGADNEEHTQRNAKRIRSA